MKKKVVEQTTGITDDVIEQFMKAHPGEFKNKSRAKQALMKSLGYTSGTREELFNQQTEARAKMAAADAAKNDKSMGANFMKALRVDNEEDLAKAMGHRKDSSRIASDKNMLRAMVKGNVAERDRRAAEEQQRRAAEEQKKKAAEKQLQMKNAGYRDSAGASRGNAVAAAAGMVPGVRKKHHHHHHHRASA